MFIQQMNCRLSSFHGLPRSLFRSIWHCQGERSFHLLGLPSGPPLQHHVFNHAEWKSEHDSHSWGSIWLQYQIIITFVYFLSTWYPFLEYSHYLSPAPTADVVINPFLTTLLVLLWIGHAWAIEYEPKQEPCLPYKKPLLQKYPHWKLVTLKAVGIFRSAR